ncbi:putative type IX sorting system protein PorV2 [Fulvivirga lutea]|uniref:PorV/PorQ family protein n=1 Tax=Fulvivirga lutea TaxID=2810512 RepID=A0A974WDG5_9BACT|nr:PorV/PorQ family protein [Fulvivirga lutea]QSE96029.1 PorV/PorQ family protein [Fulvivirga lutea]
MRQFIIIIAFLLIGAVAEAQRTPKYSNEFLSIGVGARALGMFGSQTAIADDVTAGYWNPAGLVDLSSTYQGSLMHAEYFAGIAKYDYAGFATKIDTSSSLAVSIIRFAVDDIPDTRFLYDANGAINYDNIRFFSAADYAFLISYARRLNFLDGLKVGGNFKVIHRVAGDFATAWGFGLDVGAQLKVKSWQFGLMFRDVTGTFNAWNHNTTLVEDVYLQTGNEIPENSIEVTLPKMIIGIARYQKIKTKFGLLASLDLANTFDGKRNVLLKSEVVSLDPSLGLEFDYLKTFFIRFGAGNIQEIKSFDGSTYTTVQPNFGLGVKIKQVQLDYALTDIGDQSASLYSHVFSLKASFDK